jgi:hypothetical protein
MILKDTLRYELPREGTTLLGYIVRRMHKTEWLLAVPGLVQKGETARAMAHVTAYAIMASTSFGRAFYQPRFNQQGDEASGTDPKTAGIVRARLESVNPHYLISLFVEMPDGSRLEGSERITGTTVGLRGLGMPAPSEYHFQAGNYSVTLRGTITSELVLSLLGRTRIRAYGGLSVMDGDGNAGLARIERNGRAMITVNGAEVVLEVPDQAPAWGSRKIENRPQSAA